MKRLVLALLAAAPLAAYAQTPAAPPPNEKLDPARLDAAKTLLDTMMPPARRGTMVDQLVAVSNSNILRGLNANAAFTAALRDDPRATPIFQRFLANQQAELRTLLYTNMPDMMTAMQRAYARRFSVSEMAEIRTFFASPTGQAYMDRGAKIMTDPDVSAWQQKMVAQQMSKMPEATRALAAEIMALPPKEGK